MRNDWDDRGLVISTPCRFINYPRKEGGGWWKRSTWLNVRKGFFFFTNRGFDTSWPQRPIDVQPNVTKPSFPSLFSLSFPEREEGEKRDGGIRVPLAAARSMGCRCENSISFRLSRGAATIFVFGVRARALPLNVPREGEGGRTRRSSVSSVKRLE